MDDFRVKKASEVLKRFFDDKTIQEASRFETFRSTWKQIVGQRFADHSRPKSVVHRTLLIAADHAGWIQLLQMNQARILERISKYYPELQITSLAFSVEIIGAEKGNTRVEPQNVNALHQEVTNEDQNTSSVAVAGAAHIESRDENSQFSTRSVSRVRSSELPQPLNDIFTRMRSKDARRAGEKGS